MDILSATFLTYGGRKVRISFTFPYPRVKRGVAHTRELLADEFAKATADSCDPIVRCISLELS